MRSDLVLDIIRAHRGSEREFTEAVERLAAEEDRKGNSALARAVRDASGSRERMLHRVADRSVTPQSVDAEGVRGIATAMHPDTRLEDMVLESRVRGKLEGVLNEWRNADRLPKGIRPTCRILMTGPPGCGKTMAAKALATELGLELTYVRLDGLVSHLLGRTGANIGSLFDEVKGRDTVLFIDEFDAVAKTRTDSDDVGEAKRVLAALLQNMDLLDDGTVLIAATNMPDIIDGAVIRRFDTVIEFEKPDSEQRRALIGRVSERYGFTGYDLDPLVSFTEGMSHADIESMLKSIIRHVSVNGTEGALDTTFFRGFLNIRGNDEDLKSMRESGMTLRQIEQATGIPKSTISYRIRRGKGDGQRRAVLDTGRGRVRG